MEKIKYFFYTEVKKNTELIKTILEHAVTFVISFLFGGISFSGGLSPFAVGFCTATETKYILSSSLGAAAGYAVFFGLTKGLRFIAAVCIITLVRLALTEHINARFRPAFCVGLTFFSLFLSSICVYAAIGGDRTFPVLCFCEAAIAGGFTVFSSHVTKIAAIKKKGAFFAPTDTAATIFFCCILLLSFDRFRISGFSVSHCIAFFAIMLFALCGKEAASCIAGVCCGLTLGIDLNEPYMMLCCILTGLLAGITGIYGKIPVVLSFVFSSVLSVILKGGEQNALTAIFETAISAAAFLLLPERFLFAAAKVVSPLSRDSFDDETGRSVNFTLVRFSKAVKDISQSVNAVSGMLRNYKKPECDSLYSSVKDDICRECTKYDFCWNKCEALTQKSFEKANGILTQKGRIIKEDLPERLSIICRMPDKLTDSFNGAMCRYEAMLVAKNDIYEAKKAAVMQFSCIAGLLDDAAQKLLDPPKTDPALAATLMPVFTEKGFEILGINALQTAENKSILQIYCEKVPVIPDMSRLLDEIYEKTGICYEKPVSDEYSENGTVLSFFEEGRFRATYYTSSHTGAGESFSGDTVECFSDGTGKFFAVLSDGMGTGTSAAIDSVMTCSLMSRLLRAGFDIDRAFEAVNCALLVKSTEESLSTLDIFSFDPNSAQAVFYKAGAAASVIYKDGRTVLVEKSSLPIGILKESAFEKSEITLCDGDTVFIMSDGAGVIPNLTFKDILNKNSKQDIKTLSRLIVDKALELSPSGKHDDITVTCIRIQKVPK